MIQYFLTFLTIFVLISKAECSDLTSSPLETTHIQHRSRDKHDFVFSSTEWPFLTATSTLLYTLSYLDRSPECVEIATDFVYNNSFCDARNPKHYISLKKFHSCSNRCGNPWIYKEDGPDSCPCDAVCFAYGDCCKDMSTVCPDIYARARTKYANLRYISNSCPFFTHKSDTNAITGCETMSLWDIPKTLVPLFETNVNLPMTPRVIQHYTQEFVFFAVASLSTSLIYDSQYVSHFCGANNDKFFIIPKTILLDCSNIPAIVLGNSSAFHVLKWCLKRRTRDAFTPFHRNCRPFNVVRCKCADGKFFKDYVQNACIGYKRDTSSLSRYHLWSDQVIGPRVELPDKRCTVSKMKDEDDYFKKRNRGTNMGKVFIEMSIFPVPQMNTSFTSKREQTDMFVNNTSFGNAELSWDLSTSSEHVSLKAFEGSEQWKLLPQEADMKFVVEINGTDERRFLCSSLLQYLSECQILDCAAGNILWHDPERYAHVGGCKCLAPIKVVVGTSILPIPLCFCLHVLEVLHALDAWNINLRIGDNDTLCHIDIFLRTTVEKPLEVHELANTFSFPSLQTTDTIGSASLVDAIFIQNLTDRIRDVQT